MRAWALGFGLAMACLSASAEAAPPEITMFGASWCGPCKALRAFFQQRGIGYTYRDVDDPRSLADFERASMGGRGIPLVVIGRNKVRGYNPQAILQAMGQAANEPSKSSGAGAYGGRPAAQWQQEFRELRNYLAQVEQKIAHLEKVAADHVEKAELEQMKKRKAMVEDSLSLLDADASRVALPRNYRQ